MQRLNAKFVVCAKTLKAKSDYVPYLWKQIMKINQQINQYKQNKEKKSRTVLREDSGEIMVGNHFLIGQYPSLLK